MTSILTAIENFVQNQGYSIIMSQITLLIAWLVTHLKRHGWVAPSTEQGWAGFITTAIINGITHLLSHNVANANAAPTNVHLGDLTGLLSQTGAQPSQPAQPPAVAPAPAVAAAQQPGSSAK